MSRCIAGQIRHVGFTKRPPPLGALVAATAVQTAAWRDTGETEMKREFEAKAASDHLLLGEVAKRGDDVNANPERTTGGTGKIAEEPR